MKQNIVVAVLVAIIIVLLYMIFHPSSLTQRKVAQNHIVPKTYVEVENIDLLNEDRMQNSKQTRFPPQYPVNNQNNGQNMSANYNYSNAEDIDDGSFVNNFSSKQLKNIPLQPKKSANSTSVIAQTYITRRQSGLSQNLSVCQPYKESVISEYMGMNIRYEIEIIGWVNDKCVLKFESNMLEPGNTFEDKYGISPESVEVVSFAPKIRCEFTPEQLRSVEDSSLLEEKSKNRKMLKDPNQIEFPEFKDMSSSDFKLLKILLGDRACKVVNANDFIQMFENLFQF